MLAPFQTIAIVGAGTMGNGIAHTFAQFGYTVHLIDALETSLQKGLTTISANLDRQVKKELLTEADKIATLGRIKTFTSVSNESVGSAQLVVEAVSENLELKLKLFRQFDELCPADTILASNTSSISITVLAAVTKRSDKVIGMHFMNPVPVMKLVEIIRGYDTSNATNDAIVALSRDLQKEPWESNDYPGFVANRILMPMINEAFWTLHEGVATREAIDNVMKLGMNHPMGPLTLADFIGLDICLAILRVLHDGFGNPKYAPCPLLVNLVNAGHLGRKTGRGVYSYDK
jgi:3-hydroxybutyryl-CoA dehydrogenase